MYEYFFLSDFDDLAIGSPAVADPYKDEVLLEAETVIKYRGYIDRSNVDNGHGHEEKAK
jgi:hypothetical protein